MPTIKGSFSVIFMYVLFGVAFFVSIHNPLYVTILQHRHITDSAFITEYYRQLRSLSL